MDDRPSTAPGGYLTGPAATAARKQHGPGVAVQVDGVWCWPALTDQEVYRDPWL